jgi:hypothetical protein
VCALSYNYKLQHATDATGRGVVSVVVALVIMALSQNSGRAAGRAEEVAALTMSREIWRPAAA